MLSSSNLKKRAECDTQTWPCRAILFASPGCLCLFVALAAVPTLLNKRPTDSCFYRFISVLE